MEKVCVTVSMEEERLYEKEVPEPIREYVDSLLAPPPRPRRPVRAAKAINEQATAMQQEE